ncbi:GH92 family glycosyl hydrolase [Nocardioides ferulae]|uniref:GH92 family glycosyl hydrolase n=1 Tax=Nocardioides ferulae TaxID=2340821 RepID=UPI000EAF44BA|nr:GH92 family glycosyl hydrolase [Nocardioides ferulae]
MRRRRVTSHPAAVALAAGGALHAAHASAQDQERLVDPFIGSGGTPPWFSGGTTPAAALPFGMVQLGPDTSSDAATGAPSRTPVGYAADDTLVRGFSPTHLPGAGCAAFGDVPILPVTGRLPDDPAAATAPLDRAGERAGPGWYAVRLGNGVRVRLAAAERAGLVSFRFPRGERARVLVKAAGSLAGTSATRVRFPSDREVAVTATSGGFCGSPTTYTVHVLVRFDRPFAHRGTWGGVAPGAWVGFGTRRTVRAQIGVSFVDARGARRNLDDARPGWSHQRLRARAAEVWRGELGRVRTTGGSAEERRVLDSALYRVLLSPMLLSDADGHYPGFDGVVHRVPRGRRHYTAISGWDAYRTHLPLLAWLRPDVASDVVGSLQRAGEQGGWLPRWPLVAADTGVMHGDSAAPMVAAAYALGARDFDLGPVVGALADQGERVPDAPGAVQARPGLADYLRLGYVPVDDAQPRRPGASMTLEYALDDFAVSRLAAAAGRRTVASRFAARSASWRNLLDRGWLLPRDTAGAFPPAGTDPGACCHGFEEGNASQYTWGGVPHDMAGLLAAMGPPERVLDSLVAFHSRLNVGGGGAHAWLGNQPTLGTPWAYLWLGEPALSQDVVARARTTLWSAERSGLPGNDDLGGLSAWYVWASLGLYPLTPGTADLGVGRPAFDEVLVRPSSGPATRIVRVGAGRHVAGVTVDGRPSSASWLPFGPARRPAVLQIETTDEERPVWGTGPADRPPSHPAG